MKKRVLVLVLVIVTLVSMIACAPQTSYQSPQQTEDIDYFSYLDITVDMIPSSSWSGWSDIAGTVTNNYSASLKGSFHIFFLEEDELVDVSEVVISSVGSGETIAFSKLIELTDFDSYEIYNSDIRPKR